MGFRIEHSRPASVPASADSPSADLPNKPIATPSDNIRSLAHSDDSSEEGFFCWLGTKIYEFFQSLLSCLGISSSVEQTGVSESIKRLIKCSIESCAIIKGHFNSHEFNNPDPNRTAVMVTVKYFRDASMKYETTTLFCRLSEGKENIMRSTLERVRVFLSAERNDPRGGDELSIQTLIITKNPEDTFDYSILDWNGYPSQGQGHSTASYVQKVSKELSYNRMKLAVADSRAPDDVFPQQEIEEFLG